MGMVYTPPPGNGSAGNSGNDLIPAAGSGSVLVPALTWVYFFSAVDPANPVINIGATPGGNEYGTLDLTDVGVATITGPFYFPVATTVYFSGVTPTTQFVLKR